MPFDHIVFIYEAKWNQQVKEFTVRPSRSIIQPMLEAAETISSAVLAGKLAACQPGPASNARGSMRAVRSSRGCRLAPPARRQLRA